MSMRGVLFLLVALVAAGGTAMMVRNYLHAERQAMAVQPKAPEIVLPEVLVAAEMLPAGLVIKHDHLRWQKWPQDGLTEGYVVKSDTTGIESLIGSVVRAGIGPGEPITANRIVRPGDRGFLAAILQPGMRAVAVPINATSGIAGLIFPGDKVDVILTHTINSERETEDRVRRASETVLRDIRVLATDQRTDRQDGEASLAKTVTLEVTQKQAEMLSVVTEIGKLSLSLRSLAVPQVSELAEAGEGEVETAKVLDLVMDEKKQTFTLDNDVSVLLDRPAAQSKHKAVEMNIVRGGEATQVAF